MGDQIFQGGPNISEILVPGVQIFRYIWTGGNKKWGVRFSRDRSYGRPKRLCIFFGPDQNVHVLVGDLTPEEAAAMV